MKNYTKSIVLAASLSICTIIFICNSSAALLANDSLSVDSGWKTIGTGYAVAGADQSKTKSAPTLIEPPVNSGVTIKTPAAISKKTGLPFKLSSLNKGGSVDPEKGFLFYSNNPESVYDRALADNGCWLNLAPVSGNGQVYTWHRNATNKTITSELYVINPNKSTDIIVNTNNYALTNWIGVPDVAAWDLYLGSNQPLISILVKPGEKVALFKQTVAPNSNFGIIASVQVLYTTGVPAPAIFVDQAYASSNNATKYAELDKGIIGCRGVGAYYQNTLSFDPITMSTKNYSAYYIAAKNDSFDGKDLLKLIDYGTNPSNESLLEGNYGQVMKIILPIKNRYKDNQNFGIFIGSTGGNAYPLVRLEGKNSFVSFPVKPWSAYDMIQTGEMPLNSSKTVSFTMVIPALSSTPYVIGVHPIE
jgi:hypothetical protein